MSEVAFSEPSESRGRKPPLWKVAVTLAVLTFVGWRAWSLVEGQDFSQVRIAPGWLLVSGICYAIAWLPSIAFWRRIVGALDRPPEWRLAACAYFAGHLGKYIPGKAGVMLIRAGLIRARGHSFVAGLIASANETIVMMGIGLLLAIGLAPYLVPVETLRTWTAYADRIVGAGWIPAAVIVAGLLISLPVVSKLLSAIAARFSKGTTRGARLSSTGLLQAELSMIAGWFLMGLSFGAVLQSLSPAPVAWSDWPLWTAATSASVVIGFFAIFVPGGLGVREAVMIEVLRVRPELPQSEVVMAVLILRLVWLATEGATYAALAVGQRRGGVRS